MHAYTPNNLIKLKTEKRFIFFAAACAFVTGITTIAIHQIPVPSGSFEESNATL
jgi:hypothetical protein